MTRVSPQPRTLVRWTQNVFELSSPDLPSTKNPGHPRGTSAWRTAVLKLEICSSARRSPSSTPATRESLDSPLTFDQPRRPSYTHVHMGGCSWRWARRSSSMGVIAAGGVDGGGRSAQIGSEPGTYADEAARRPAAPGSERHQVRQLSGDVANSISRRRRVSCSGTCRSLLVASSLAIYSK